MNSTQLDNRHTAGWYDDGWFYIQHDAATEKPRINFEPAEISGLRAFLTGSARCAYLSALHCVERPYSSYGSSMIVLHSGPHSYQLAGPAIKRLLVLLAAGPGATKEVSHAAE